MNENDDVLLENGFEDFKDEEFLEGYKSNEDVDSDNESNTNSDNGVDASKEISNKKRKLESFKLSRKAVNISKWRL